jgi:uncharacterized protein YkwD
MHLAIDGGPRPDTGRLPLRWINVARLIRRAGLVLVLIATAVTPASFAASTRLRWRAPTLSPPLSEGYPDPTRPADPVKAAVFDRINDDRARFGFAPVLWDELASRISDEFCMRQVREKTHGHFLLDGVPPYARMSLGGVLAMSSENAVSWVTTGTRFPEPTISLALEGEAEMMAEKPPSDGHRVTILDPEATHVGVGYAISSGRFQMTEEFLTRRFDRITLGDASGTLSVSGRPRTGYQLRFVTIAREEPPRPITREEATRRTGYSYPRPSLAYVPETVHSVRVVGVMTEEHIQVFPSGEFVFSFHPERAGLYTFQFYAAKNGAILPRPGAAATVWVE